MNVYQKLQTARLLLQEKKLGKSGKNKFAGYEYFELQDFLPAVQTIFSDVGLCAVFRCDADSAFLMVYNTDKPEEVINFTAPMAAAELKGCHPVQNLGASISYLRRYLYVNALEIVEHDALDATTGKEPAPAPKPVAKPIPAPPVATKVATTAGGNPIVTDAPQPKGDWKITVSGNEEGLPAVVEQAANVLLKLASSSDEVMTIYKTNKQVFEQFKSIDGVAFKALMDKFAERKKELSEAA